MHGKNTPARRRFKTLFGWATALATFVTAAALAWIFAGGAEVRWHLVAALSLAVYLSMYLAAALMGLVFLSSESGHDQAAADEAARHDPDGWLDD